MEHHFYKISSIASKTPNGIPLNHLGVIYNQIKAGQVIYSESQGYILANDESPQKLLEMALILAQAYQAMHSEY